MFSGIPYSEVLKFEYEALRWQCAPPCVHLCEAPNAMGASVGVGQNGAHLWITERPAGTPKKPALLGEGPMPYLTAEALHLSHKHQQT